MDVACAGAWIGLEGKKKNQSKMQFPEAMVHGELLRVGEGQADRQDSQIVRSVCPL